MFNYSEIVLHHQYWYAGLKILHIVAMVCWFAGLFYLPRLFVYHSMSSDVLSKNKFKIMEHKLYWYIMCPAAVVTIIAGELLAHVFLFHGMWLHIKVGLVAILFLYHIWCFKIMDDFAKDVNIHSHKFYRYYNEFPTIILILCVVLVVLKLPA